MQNLFTTIRKEVLDWEQESSDPNRYSVFTQHLMLAEMIRNHQHLTSATSKTTSPDDTSFCTLDTDLSDVNRDDSPTIPALDTFLRTPSVTPLPTSLPSPIHTPIPSRSSSIRANMGKVRTSGPRISNPAIFLADDWTYGPLIPKRTSSMNTGRRLGKTPSRLDLSSLHHRSRQIFSSLDSTLSNAIPSTGSTTPPSSSSTSPSLVSNVTTQATSILDDEWHIGASYAPLYLELRDPRVVIQDDAQQSPDFGDFLGTEASPKRLSVQRSASKLSPRITSTVQKFWTSEESRNAEYAKIDAAHRGVRGFLKRILPKWIRIRGKRRNFYSSPSPIEPERSSRVDDDSVRRYRISIASVTQEAILNAELHGVSSMQKRRKSTPQPSNEAGMPANSNQRADAKPQRGLIHKRFAKVRSTENLLKFSVSSHTVWETESITNLMDWGIAHYDNLRNASYAHCWSNAAMQMHTLIWTWENDFYEMKTTPMCQLMPYEWLWHMIVLHIEHCETKSKSAWCPPGLFFPMPNSIPLSRKCYVKNRANAAGLPRIMTRLRLSGRMFLRVYIYSTGHIFEWLCWSLKVAILR